VASFGSEIGRISNSIQLRVKGVMVTFGAITLSAGRVVRPYVASIGHSLISRLGAKCPPRLFWTLTNFLSEPQK
jgi:hypothetical protein